MLLFKIFFRPTAKIHAKNRLGEFLSPPFTRVRATSVPLWKISNTMLKLLFWGFIGYIVYRYFQLKEQLKEGRHRDFMQQQQQEQHAQQASPEKMQNDGEYIDYEEIK